MTPIVTSAVLMGIFGGVHCVAMCGGVVGVLCSACPRSSKLSQAPYWIAYNAGRLVSYTAMGLVLGLLGSQLDALDGARILLRALAAVCMLAAGLHLAGFPTGMKRLESIGAPIWRRLSPITKRLLPLRSPWHALGLGVVWGFMPCGLLYGALALAASSGSGPLGAATMAAFGVSTLPAVVGMMAIAGGLARWSVKAKVRRAAGVLVLGFGMWSALGVLGQLGVTDAFGESRHCCPTR